MGQYRYLMPCAKKYRLDFRPGNRYGSGMNIKTILLAACVVCAMAPSQGRAQSVVSAGARYHSRHSQFTELPYANGDMSYVLGYEYHDAGGFWQFLLGYAPTISKGSDGRGAGVESVLTPQLNLLLEDRNFIAGVGILASYISAEGGDDWTDVFWQVMAGYEIPLPLFKLELMVYYPFEKWKTFRDFKTGDLEFGASLKRSF